MEIHPSFLLDKGTFILHLILIKVRPVGFRGTSVWWRDSRFLGALCILPRIGFQRQLERNLVIVL
jgi:hypothetical protein